MADDSEKERVRDSLDGVDENGEVRSSPPADSRSDARQFRNKARSDQKGHTSESAAYRDASTNIHIHHAQIGGGFINNSQHGGIRNGIHNNDTV